LFENVQAYIKQNKCSIIFALALFKKSKSWYYFWKNKSDNNDLQDQRGWKKGNTRKFVNYDLKLEIQKIRDDLELHSSFFGSDEILVKMKEKQLNPLPSERYIRTVLKQLGYQDKKKKVAYQHSDTYPINCLVNSKKDSILALDFLGPKSLTNKEVVLGLTFSLGKIAKRLEPIERKTTDELINKFMQFLHYTQHIPNFVQTDNDSVFLGNVAGNLQFGRFVRLCLNLKITPIFIPEGEPYFNGLAESVNSQFMKKVWHNKYFENKKDIDQEMINFSDEYCKRLKIKQTKLFTTQRLKYQQSALNNKKYTLKQLTNTLLPKAARKIILIRKVKEHQQYNYAYISVLNYPLELPKQYIGCYVAAVYNIKFKVMKIYLKSGNQLLLIKQIKLKISI